MDLNELSSCRLTRIQPDFFMFIPNFKEIKIRRYETHFQKNF